MIGTEANNLALHVFEAPGVNMARIPVLGRNFEYFGEDPYLTGTMAVAEIKAVQAKGVIAMAKHFAANEQETNRMTIQETVDEGCCTSSTCCRSKWRSRTGIPLPSCVRTTPSMGSRPAKTRNC